MKERGEVFRQKSIERLAHPEHLDELMDVTRPQGWLILLTLGLLIVGALAWSATGSVAIQEPIEGVLMGADRQELTAPSAGVVLQVTTQAGAILGAGELLGSLVNLEEADVPMALPFEARVLEVLMRPGQHVSQGQLLASVESTGGALGAVTWVSIDTSRQLKLDMEARLIPSGVSPQRFGFLKGRIVQIASVPSTQRGIAHAVDDEVLANSLYERGMRVRVDIDLAQSAEAKGRWAWTSNGRSEPELTSRTPLTGNIILRRSRPIEHILPWLIQDEKTE